MTAGTEVVCNDVVRKVEIEEKSVAGLDMSDPNKVGAAAAAIDGNVGGNGNVNVGGDGKEDTDDSSYVFVSGGIEVIAGDPDDAGGVNGDAIAPKSDSADEVDQFTKEELGIENEGIPVDPLVLETNGIVYGSARVMDAEVKAVQDEVNLENGSTVEPSVVLETNDIAQDVNGHLCKITGEEGGIVKNFHEVEDANGITNVDAKMDDIVFGVTFDPESTLNPIECSQVTVFESESTIKPSEESKSQGTITQSVSMPDVINTTDESLSTPIPVRNTDCEVMVNDGADLISTLIDKAESQVIADGLESSGSPIKETEGQVTVDGSSKPSEDLECQVTADGPDASGSPIKERECQVSIVGPESIGSPVDNQECPASVDESESIGNSVDNQECPVSVDGSEFSGNHTEEVDSTTVVESDRKSEELSVVTLEVNVEAEPYHVCGVIKDEHQSESVSAPCTSDNIKAEGAVIGSGTELEENSDSGLVFPQDADAPANGQVEKFDGILEMGETQISRTDADEGEGAVIGSGTELEENPDSGLVLPEDADAPAYGQVQKFDGILDMEETQISRTEADEGVPVLFNDEKAKSEEKLEEQVEGSSETLLKMTESVELEANFEETKEQAKIEDEIQESQIVAGDNVQDDLNLEDNTEESANESEAPLETETNIEFITSENTASQYEVSSCTNKSEDGFAPEGAENVEIFPSTDSVKSECKTDELLVEKDNDSLSNPVANLVTKNKSAEGMDRGTGIDDVDASYDEEKETEAKDAPVGDHSKLSFPDTYVNPGAVIEFGSIGRHETVPDVQNDDGIAVPDVVNGETKPACGADSDNSEHYVDGSYGDRNSDKMSCPEVTDMDGIQSDEIPTSSVEGSVSDAIDVQNEEAEVLAYNFLIRIPRLEDETFRDQIRSAQLQVDEKTRLRDAIRVEIQGKRARLKAHNEAFNAAKLEETAARRLVRLKRQEIDSVQSVINRVKNAMSVEDIDGRIYNMEHMIQHETLCLKDEKQFIREIKQLKTLRDQLASNMGTKDEVQQALDQKDQTEERMKTLRKELDSLKDKVSKAEAVAMAVQKKYDEESKRERALQAQFRAADDVRQKAYAHLNSLKKQSYDKNKNFRKYKEDVMAARDFASRGDKDALHRLCANQVEAFMEQWNNNDEFRDEYISRCNMNASRRQRALDGSSLSPDDVSPVLPSIENERVERSLVSIPVEVKTFSVEQKKIVSSSEDNKSIENASGKKNQTLKTKDVSKPTLGSEMVIEKNEAIDIKKEEDVQTKEEMELARKAEELRKEEIAAKLKEQRRMEEKAKAIEALERKKRNAEKAQIRAELRARKEAEQKEKEREKRLRKKEKKKGGGVGEVSTNGEDAASSESSNEAATTKEMEVVKEEKSMKKKKKAAAPPHFFSKQLKPKPVPPPLINKNKKRWQQWGKLLIAAVLVLALFLLGNTGSFLNLKVPKANPTI